VIVKIQYQLGHKRGYILFWCIAAILYSLAGLMLAMTTSGNKVLRSILVKIQYFPPFKFYPYFLQIAFVAALLTCFTAVKDTVIKTRDAATTAATGVAAAVAVVAGTAKRIRLRSPVFMEDAGVDNIVLVAYH